MSALTAADPLVDLDDDQLRARDSAKWAMPQPGVLPAWVAEMDFALSRPVEEALVGAVRRGAVGYSPPDRLAGLAEDLCQFTARRWAWAPDPSSVVLVPDTMTGVELVLRTLCAEAPVVVPTPAYPPFLDVVPLTGHRLVTVPLAPDASRAVLDLDAIGAALAAGARTVLLCQPHNPWGRVFDGQELSALRDVVDRFGARVVSDEVHAPLVLPGSTHLPYAAVEGTTGHTTTVLSAAKAWNMPGVRSAQLVLGSQADVTAVRGLPLVANHGSSPLGIQATRAAYRLGEPWLDALLLRLDANRALFAHLVSRMLPRVRMRALEATYLAWLDVRSLGLAEPARVALARGRVLVSEGATFGPGGQGHVRVNLATSPRRVAEVVRRLATAWATASQLD